MKRKAAAIACAVTILSLALSGVGIAHDNKPQQNPEGTITLRMAQTSAADGAIGISMDEFADRIYQATNGRYQIQTYHNGQLGGEVDTIEGCQMNTIDIAVVNQSTLGNFMKDFQALDIPFLFNSPEHADKVFLGDIGQSYLGKLDEINLKGLGIWESGFRNLTNSKHPVNSVDDVHGLKIRTMENQIHIAFWKKLGADATPMSWGEAYTALQQGALDGQENPCTVIDKNNVAQVNKYLALTQHAYSTVFIIMSPATWDSLGEEYQKIFMDCMNEENLKERERSRQMDQEAIGHLKEQGMEITEPDKQQFRDAAADLYTEWQAKYGDTIAKIQALGTQ